MRSKLFSLILAPAVMAAAVLAINPAMAETASVKVPFSFTVAGKALPAGLYRVEWSSPGNFVSLVSSSSLETFTWAASPSGTNGGKVTLKFNEVGQTHALRSIQYGPLETGRLDRKPKPTEWVPAGSVQGQ